MSDEELTELFGALMEHSDHKRGETVKFSQEGQIQSGVILWITPPGPSYQGGPDRPMTYWADTGKGMPVPVYPGEVVE